MDLEGCPRTPLQKKRVFDGLALGGASLVTMGQFVLLKFHVAQSTDVEHCLVCTIAEMLAFLGTTTILESVANVVQGHVLWGDKILFPLLLLLVRWGNLK